MNGRTRTLSTRSGLLSLGTVALGAVALGAAPAGAGFHAADRQGAGRCEAAGPGARSGAALAYHAGMRRVLMFGGWSDDAAEHYPRTLWAWDGRGWTCVAGDGPPGRTDGEMAYDARRDRLVLFGGRRRDAAGGLLRDTWEWDGGRWMLADSTGPRRIHVAIAYDSARDAVVMHGGLGAPGPDPLLRDSFAWDGSAWRPLALPATPAGAAHHVAILPGPDGLVLVDAAEDRAAGCVSDSVWQRARVRLFALRDGAWVPLGAAGGCFGGATPVARTTRGILLYAMWPSADPAAGAEAWLWREGEWKRVDGAPSRRRGARVAYDPGRDVVVLFGGNDGRGNLDETWEWDAAAGWVLRVPR